MAVAINKPENGEDLVSVFNSLKYVFGDTYAKEFQKVQSTQSTVQLYKSLHQKQ